MSVQIVLPGFDGAESKSRPPAAEKRASLHREMRYLLTISTETSKRGSVTPAGLVHSLGVCLIEDWNMVRGKGDTKGKAGQGGMPRFIDVRLTTEERAEFVRTRDVYADSVRWLRDFTDAGYRVGVSWSGEHQSYTVSVTCRDVGSPNSGLCMTSFAGDLSTAIALAAYKHYVVLEGAWLSAADHQTEPFG